MPEKSALRLVPTQKPDFTMREDDFSVQVASMSDALFWVRIEKTDGPPILVSDLKISTLPREKVTEALNKALDALALGQSLSRMCFKDIAPNGTDDQADRAAAELAPVIVDLARSRGYQVAQISKSFRARKVDLNVDFEPRT